MFDNYIGNISLKQQFRQQISFQETHCFLNYIYLKNMLQITNRLFINKIKKLQSEYLFTRNLSLIQYPIDMSKSIN